MELKEVTILDKIKFTHKYFKAGISSYDHQLPGPGDVVLLKIKFVNQTDSYLITIN